LVPDIVPISAEDLHRVHEIDISEETEAIYVQVGSRLERVAEAHNRTRRPAEEWSEEVRLWQSFVRSGGGAFGVLDAGSLLGFSVLRAGLGPTTSQLAGLYVDRAWRRRGLGTALVGAAVKAARDGGATNLYVSASRYESAVTFYLGLGFEPLAHPHPELLALEPTDLHMSLEIPRGE
jgi:ribosomal protein S18 acetylase RimI-like enzyme